MIRIKVNNKINQFKQKFNEYILISDADISFLQNYEKIEKMENDFLDINLKSQIKSLIYYLLGILN